MDTVWVTEWVGVGLPILFLKTSLSPRSFDGFLERRIPGKKLPLDGLPFPLSIFELGDEKLCEALTQPLSCEGPGLSRPEGQSRVLSPWLKWSQYVTYIYIYIDIIDI